MKVEKFRFVRVWAGRFKMGDSVGVGERKLPATVQAVEESMVETHVPAGHVPICYEHDPATLETAPADDLTLLLG